MKIQRDWESTMKLVGRTLSWCECTPKMVLNTYQIYGVTLCHLRCSRWDKRNTPYMVCIAHFFYSAFIAVTIEMHKNKTDKEY